jgi:hypothetical protein
LKGKIMSPFVFVASLMLTYVCVASADAEVLISAAPTQNMSCSDGMCAPSAPHAVLNTGDLENYLATGNLKLTTLGSGVQAQDIVVKAPFSWSSSYTLSLDAWRTIGVEAAVMASGTTPGLTITTNDGGSGGVFVFGKKGSIGFADFASTLIINGATYNLVESLSALAQNIMQNPVGNYALDGSFEAGGTYTRAPIKTFQGHLEGLGNTIGDLVISAKQAKGGGIGLIATSSGTISNLRLTGMISVKRGGGPVGGLIGTNSGAVFDSQADVTISSGDYAATGGLIGYSSGGAILLSSSEGNIAGGFSCYCGGLVGRNFTAISNSYSDAAVSGTGFVGGLVGTNNDEVVIENSYATGTVTSGDGGGLVGDNGGIIANSFATGLVTDNGAGAIYIGGLVGYNSTAGSITNSYALGSTSAYSGNIGGFAGQNYGSIEAAYSIGMVQVTGDSVTLGGFVGDDESSGGIANAYWDTSTSGVTNPSQGAGNIANDPGISGLTTEQFQSGLPAGFDPKTWAEKTNENAGFPYLVLNPPPK